MSNSPVYCKPRTGTKQEASPPYFPCSGAYTVNTATPTLRDTFVDADGDKVNGTFQIYDNATNTQVGDVIVSRYVPSGQVASVTIPSDVRQARRGLFPSRRSSYACCVPT